MILMAGSYLDISVEKKKQGHLNIINIVLIATSVVCALVLFIRTQLIDRCYGK